MFKFTCAVTVAWYVAGEFTCAWRDYVRASALSIFGPALKHSHQNPNFFFRLSTPPHHGLSILPFRAYSVSHVGPSTLYMARWQSFLFECDCPTYASSLCGLFCHSYTDRFLYSRWQTSYLSLLSTSRPALTFLLLPTTHVAEFWPRWAFFFNNFPPYLYDDPKLFKLEYLRASWSSDAFIKFLLNNIFWHCSSIKREADHHTLSTVANWGLRMFHRMEGRLLGFLRP